MHAIRGPFLTLACAGLLASQLSGLHMHMNAEGYVGAPSGTHVHGTAVHEHDGAPGRHAHGAPADHGHPLDPDHAGDLDISLIELLAGASKLLIVFTWLGLGLLLVLGPGGRVCIPLTMLPARTRLDWWRPPLRAPPARSPSF